MADDLLFSVDQPSSFQVVLDNYAGPFDVLLSMISEQKLDVTTIALARITTDFIEYVAKLEAEDNPDNLDEISAFLDVASILIAAKSAALLPHDEQREYQDQGLEALRERDLLFARLLQYRAFKQAADEIREHFLEYESMVPHMPSVEVGEDRQLQRLEWNIDVQAFAHIAAMAIAQAPAQTVSVHQLHVPLVDVQAQTKRVWDMIRSLDQGRIITFSQLVEQQSSKLHIVATFLAVLSIFKQGHIRMRQVQAFSDIEIQRSDHAVTIDTTLGDDDVQE